MTFGLLCSLFWIAFISATLLPAQSELALAAALLASGIPWWLCIFAAWTGNTAGSCVNWLMGKYLKHFEGKKWFPVSAAGIARAEKWYGKYGRWSLLLSWMPVIGDPITLAAGVLGEKFAPFLVLTGLAKLARYICVAFLAAGAA